jgi:hypothetical protein
MHAAQPAIPLGLLMGHLAICDRLEQTVGVFLLWFCSAAFALRSAIRPWGGRKRRSRWPATAYLKNDAWQIKLANKGRQ